MTKMKMTVIFKMSNIVREHSVQRVGVVVVVKSTVNPS